MIGGGSSYSKSIKDNYNPSFNINLSLGYVISTKLMLRFDYQYIRFENKKKSNEIFVEELGDISKLTSSVYKVDAMYGHLNTLSQFQLYLIGGFGFYNTDVFKKNNDTVISETNTNLGLGGGFGFSIKLGKNDRISLECEYNHIFNEGTFKSYVPLKLGYNHNFIKREKKQIKK